MSNQSLSGKIPPPPSNPPLKGEDAPEDLSQMDKVHFYRQSGQMDKAYDVARDFVQSEPQNPQAQHAIAVVLMSRNQAMDALGYARQAVQLSKNDAYYTNALGLTLRAANRSLEAAEIYKALLKENENPDNEIMPQAWNNYGLCLIELGQYKAAEIAFENALSLLDDFAEAWNNLGSMRHRQGRLDEALSCFDRAIAINNQYGEAWQNRGETLAQDGKSMLEAMKALRRAVECQPHNQTSRYRLAHFLVRCGEFQHALDVGKTVLERDPNHRDTLLTMAVASEQLSLHEQAQKYLHQILLSHEDDLSTLTMLAKSKMKTGLPFEAMALAEKVLRHKPQEGALYHLLGEAHSYIGKDQKAMEYFATANRLSPDNPYIETAIARILLLNGQYRQGFIGYRSRYELPDSMLLYNGAERKGREWTKEAKTEGRRLLISSQGHIDEELLFFRFIPEIQKKWPELESIGVHVSNEMANLARNKSGIIVYDQESPPRPSDYDLFLPYGDLALHFDVSAKEVSYPGPYLPITQEANYRLKQASHYDLRVGISLSPDHMAMTNQGAPNSAPLEMLEFEHALKFENIGYYRLDYPQNPNEIEIERQLGEEYGNLYLLDQELDNLMDRIRMISAVDLVITIDNHMAHLAGALNIPCWNLLDFHCPWYWGKSGSYNPWYPQLRLVRPRVIGDWQMSVRDVTDNLAQLISRQDG